MFVASAAVQQRLCRIGHEPSVLNYVLRRCPLQSLHLLLTRLWAKMPSPPQTQQRRLSRLCSQMLAPPQSLQWLLAQLCWQILVPPQSLFWLL